MENIVDILWKNCIQNVSGDCGAWIKAGVSDIDKGVMVMDKYYLMKHINKAANQMMDDANEVKERLWKALYKGRKKKFVKTLKTVRKCAPNENAVNECEDYVLNNWDSAVLRMQDKNVYGCSAEGHVSHVYSDRMIQTHGVERDRGGCHVPAEMLVRDYGEDKVVDLVHHRRSHREKKAAGCEESEPKLARGYVKKLLHGQHDSDRVYLERIRATIPSVEIRKKLAIRERISNI